LTLELSQPELGHVDRRMAVASLPDLSQATLEQVDWSKIQVLAAFSRNWDPRFSPMHWGPVLRFWSRFFGYVPNATREETRRRVPFAIENRLERQWLDIYVNRR
jgi:hypothetical protein